MFVHGSVSVDTLYRGITIDPELLKDPNNFVAAIHAQNDLQPGPRHVNANGEATVKSGDEYGVYMTGDRAMAETYAVLTRNDHIIQAAMPLLLNGEVVEYTHPDEDFGYVQTVLQMPSLGVVHTIDATSLPGMRPPKYREGRAVSEAELRHMPEWLADVVPASRVHAVSAHIGPDLLHDTGSRFNAHDPGLHDKVSAVFNGRMRDLVYFGEQLVRLDDKYDPTQVQRVINLAR